MEKLKPTTLDLTLVIPIILGIFFPNGFLFYLAFLNASSNVSLARKCQMVYNFSK
jgi:hypothetical protein